MGGIKILFIGLVVAVVFYYSRIIRAAKNLKFSAGKLKSFNLKGGDISWIQLVNVQNGDATPIPVTAANVQPWVGLTQIGSCYLKKSSIIAGRSTTALEFQVNVPYVDLLYLGLEVASAFQSGKLTFDLKGYVNAVGVDVPINEKFNINI